LVIICHDMRRELPRTLRSLAAPYQRGCPRGRCEIIVVDNGSAVPPHGEDFASLDADIRVLHQPEPTASPVAAVNTGLAAARAGLIGVWIDGARMASPGLIAACLHAAILHPRPVIATLNYQIGPMLESNALFLPRALWRELGGYDPAFTEPGGGGVNPDTFIRACLLPGAQLIRVLGEGTFHQFHGGLSTSTPDGAMHVVKQASRAYLRRRGRPLAAVRHSGWLYDASTGEVARP
jgi:hypothetical protein